MNSIKELADFLKEQKFNGIRWKFFSGKCLEIFAEDRDCLNDVLPLLGGFEVTEKIKDFADRSTNITIAIV